MQKPTSSSFTIIYPGISQELKSECGVGQAIIDPTNSPIQAKVTVNAIWDTGATNSVITQQVVDACNLEQISTAEVIGVHGPELSGVYIVAIYLPNKMIYPVVRVTKAKLAHGKFDMLIGMDIIASGDLAITNKDGKTMFSFHYPSRHSIDFVKNTNQVAKPPKQKGRNRKKW